MQINKVNYNNPTYFGRRLPDRIYEKIEDINSMPCAICGKKMFSSKELVQILDSFSPKISEVMKDERISAYKDTNAYAFLQSIAKKHPRTPIRNALKDSNFGVKFQFLPEYTQKVFKNILSKFGKTNISAQEAVKKFQKLRPYMDEQNNALIDVLSKYADKYPGKGFSEIFSLPEVYEFHNNNLLRHRNNIKNELDKYLSAINKLAEQLPEHERDEIGIIEYEVVRNMLNKVYFKPFLKSQDGEILKDIYTGKPIYEKNFYIKPSVKKILVLSQYEDLLKHSSKPEVIKEILKIAKKLPFETDYSDFFIVENINCGNSDRDIISKILVQVLNTYEHIVPKSKNGEDTLSNGLRVHKCCNEERDVIPYSIFAEYKPELIKNIQKQINIITSYIVNGKLLNSDTCPLKLQKTLKDASDNKIVLNLDKYIEKFMKMVEDKQLEVDNKIYIVDNLRQQNKNSSVIKTAQMAVEISIVKANNAQKRLNKFLKELNKE